MLTASKTGRTMLSGSEKGRRLCCHGLNQEEDNANRVWNRKRTMLTGSEMGRGQSWQSEAIDWGQCWQSLKQVHSGSHRTTLTGYEMTMLTRSELRRGLYLEGLVLKADKQRADSNLQKEQKMQSVVQHSSPWYSHHSWLRFILKRGHCSGQRLVDWLPPPPPTTTGLLTFSSTWGKFSEDFAVSSTQDGGPEVSVAWHSGVQQDSLFG